jgi:2',3'-cyclic-nucleotide 2'-phosphodiesterase (5'-nucleotidase family)
VALAAAWVAIAATALAASSCHRVPRTAPGTERTPTAAAPSPFPAPSPAPPPPRGRVVSVVYSSNLLGRYENCGCPVHPLGGVARRATQVDRARAESDALLVVDAGDLLTTEAPAARAPPGDRAAPSASEIERRARLLAAAFARTGTSALLPGERDLAIGLPLLRRIARDARLPLVASNLYDASGKLLFDPDRVVDGAGLRVGIFGVAAPPTAGDAYAFRAAGIDARDPVAAARAEVASLRGRGARVIVALVHVGAMAESRRLIAAVPGIDWAVLGHSGMQLEMPEDVGGTRMLEALREGKELGRLDLHVVDGSTAFIDRGERAQIETILADHRRQLTEYDHRLGETDPESLRDYYANRRQQIEAAIARESALLERRPARITGSWFENRIIPLDADTPDQVGVAVLVAAYDRESARLAAAGKPAGVGERVRPAPPPAPAATYVGSAACGACHGPELGFWKASKHGRALMALARVGRDRDPACVGCHVTGYLGAGGPADPPAARAAFAGVGCESCHGPGSAHVAAARAKTPDRSMAAAVGEAVCLGCHTPDQTGGDFDFGVFRRAVLGPGHGAPL